MELILCCGEMCQKKKFTVPRLQTADVSSSVSSTTSSTPQSKKTVDADVSDFLKVCNDNVATLSGDTKIFHLPIVTQTNTDKNQYSYFSLTLVVFLFCLHKTVMQSCM